MSAALFGPTICSPSCTSSRTASRTTRPPYEECLTRSVADIVRKQAEVGIDIVSDGEYGKTISWSRYMLDRMGGFEERHDTTPGFRSAVAGKDRRDFAEFYEEYEADLRLRRHGQAPSRPALGWSPARSSTPGQAAIKRDIEDFKKAIAGVRWRTRSCRSWRRQASCRSARTNITSPRKRRCSPSPMRCARNTRRSSMPG